MVWKGDLKERTTGNKKSTESAGAGIKLYQER